MNAELLMFYNVENFFPPDGDSVTDPNSGLRNWDSYKYRQKVRNITNVFRFVAQDRGQLPSIIGLAEIGDRVVLEDLLKNDSPLKDYQILYQKSEDSRGLSVALLFDPQKYTLLDFRTLKFKKDSDLAFETRDILHAEFQYEGKKIHFFVLHLPSKREGDIQKKHRLYIIQQLRKTVRNLCDQGEPIILMGDFNENPDAEEMQLLLYDTTGKKILTNPFETLYLGGRFTTFHNKKGLGFDQILFSEEMLCEQLNLETITADIYDSPILINKTNGHRHYPLRTYSGSRYIGGYSDHFPVLVTLNRQE